MCPYLNPPHTEVPRVEMRLSATTDCCVAVLHAMLPGIVAYTTTRAQGLTQSQVAWAAATPQQGEAQQQPVSELSIRDNTSDVSQKSLAIIPPPGSAVSEAPVISTNADVLRRVPFYDIFVKDGVRALVPFVAASVGGSPEDVSSLPGGASFLEIALRSFVRSCQDNEDKDAYAKLFLCSLSAMIPADSVLHLRRSLENIRFLILQKWDTLASGICAPLTFTLAVKSVWPFVHAMDLDVLNRLIDPTLLRGDPDAPDVADTLGGSLTDCAPDATQAPTFWYIKALNDIHSDAHQFLVRAFLHGLMSSSAVVAHQLKSSAKTADSGGVSSVLPSVPIASVVSALTKLDARWDKAQWRRHISQILGTDIADAPSTARLDLHSLLHGIPQVVYLHSAPSSEPLSGSMSTPTRSMVPLVETREAEAPFKATPPSTETGALKRVASIAVRRKSSVKPEKGSS